MSPTILFDMRGAQMTGDVTFHGGGEYARAVLERFDRRALTDKLCILVSESLSSTRYSTYATQLAKTGAHLLSDAHLRSRAWPDSVHTYYSPLPYALDLEAFEQLRRVGTVHGLRPIECPTDAYEWRCRSLRQLPRVLAKRVFRNSYVNRQTKRFVHLVSGFDRIIAPSEHTRAALLKLIGSEQQRQIDVLYSPMTEVMRTTPATNFDVLHDLGLRAGRYILLVSGNRYEKNAVRGLRAIKQLQTVVPDSMQGLKIVVTGGLPRLRKWETPEGLVTVPYLPVSDLCQVYAGCALFFYPSLNEGFGYPPLEALAAGAQVVASSACSLQELLGGVVPLFSPLDSAEIATRVLQALNSPVDKASTDRTLQEITNRQNSDLDYLVDLLCND